MKKILALAVILLLGFGLTGCSLFNTATTTTTVTTTVDTNNFIEINSVSDLQNMEMNKSYILNTDLDLTGIDWKPIGNIETPYLGIFDGNGHTISNMTINSENDNFNGLFGYIQGTVKDLNITDYSINYTTNFLTYAGGLAGYLIGDATNVTATGTINIVNNKSNTFAGLLVGLTQAFLDSTVTAKNFVPNVLDNNSVSGDITVSPKKFAYIGGLAGKAYNTELTNNQASGTITSTGGGKYRVYVGGLVGHFYGGILVGFEDQVDSTDILIQNNFANEEINVANAVTGASVGGFMGLAQYGNIKDNAAISNITAAGNYLYVGGFIGENWNSPLENIMVDDTVNITVAASIDTEVPTYSMGTIIGNDFTNTQITNSYYLFTTSNDTYDKQGVLGQLANYQSSSWLENTMKWNSIFYNKILPIVNS